MFSSNTTVLETLRYNSASTKKTSDTASRTLCSQCATWQNEHIRFNRNVLYCYSAAVQEHFQTAVKTYFPSHSQN